MDDNNPLFNDVHYAQATCWKQVLASPMFMITMGKEVSGPLPADLRERTEGALSGIGMYQSGYEFEFYRPIYPGDELEKRSGVCHAEEKQSEFAGRSIDLLKPAGRACRGVLIPAGLLGARHGGKARKSGQPSPVHCTHP